MKDFHISVHKVEYRLVSNFETWGEAHTEGARICNKLRKEDPANEYWFDVEEVEEKDE